MDMASLGDAIEFGKLAEIPHMVTVNTDWSQVMVISYATGWDVEPVAAFSQGTLADALECRLQEPPAGIFSKQKQRLVEKGGHGQQHCDVGNLLGCAEDVSGLTIES